MIDKKEYVNTIELRPNNYVLIYNLKKQQAIVDEVMNLAQFIVHNMHCAFPKKRIFRKKDRRPLRRIKMKRAMLAMGIAPAIARNRILMIASQPISKFPPGNTATNGFAIVGESGSEFILTPNGKVNAPSINQHPDQNIQPPNPICPLPAIH